MLRYLCLVMLLLACEARKRQTKKCTHEGKDYTVSRRKPTFKIGCNKCTCHNGEVMCTLRNCAENKRCLYLDEEGKTKNVTVGEFYTDGCNACVCPDKDGDVCTSKRCENKCHYTNRDGVSGYIEIGKTVTNGSKSYRCKIKGRGTEMECMKTCLYLDGNGNAKTGTKCSEDGSDACTVEGHCDGCSYKKEDGALSFVKYGAKIKEGCKTCKCLKKTEKRWCQYPNTYLSFYSSNEHFYETLAKAQEECLTRKDCRGITKEPRNSKYSLRKSTYLKYSSTNETSYKKCEIEQGKIECRRTKRCRNEEGNEKKDDKTHCVYLDYNAKTQNVKVGEWYNNGCSDCKCKSKKDKCETDVELCDDKCPYTNKDNATRYFTQKMEISDGCKTCICKTIGGKSIMECTPKTCPDNDEENNDKRCLYLDSEGKQQNVAVGDPYNNGCFECTCSKDGNDACNRISGCIGCTYTDKDGAFGYIRYGTNFNDGCKKCECLKRTGVTCSPTTCQNNETEKGEDCEYVDYKDNVTKFAKPKDVYWTSDVTSCICISGDLSACDRS